MGDKMMASAAIDRAVKAPAPVGEINMTPLIDVLLVLLIMESENSRSCTILRIPLIMACWI